MRTYDEYLAALDEFAGITARFEAPVAEAQAEHASDVGRISAAQTRRTERTGSLRALVDDALARGRDALEPVELTDAIPRKVRPGAAASALPADAAGAELDRAVDVVAGAASALERHRVEARQRRRDAFTLEKRRREEEERRRRERELQAARGRALLLRVCVGAAIVVVLVVLVLSS